ncbi:MULTISPECIES: hypothetical protein [Pseudomonas aeruginosa group]|uniref:hypothetical protein n=1 Tax=Pseudomonas aeruginosa group TaxID=136841 RepID=UPI000ACC5A0D|nr:hypothetical protein [Pseudomonas aeruginosa]MCO1765824.1 hypothetical protein [Pseudomonas aeruginosa]MCS9872585.1 hypothetical protein [Pseudomonas aeruginosa]MCT4502895.1 hypothetical protein [Pseudomonas aeruginosa]QGP99125.1 hypothetical protein FC629_26290 [Pseudomonas aeruginosa]QUS32217.1 hypothetical protein IFJ77_03120 [Pseudomonas aeruginosa]
MKYSLSSKVIFPWGGAGGELGGAARTTLPSPGHGADGELSVAARNTLPRIDLGAPANWVVRPAPLCQVLASAPTAN